MKTNSHPPSDFLANRLVSLDSFRGFIMLLLLTGGLGFAQTAQRLAERNQSSDAINFLANQFSHVDYIGCSFWDLIQPAFIVMVGLAMPYSIAGQLSRNMSYSARQWHAIKRAVILIALGIFLSLKLLRLEPHFNWHLYNVLTPDWPRLCFCLLSRR